MLSVVFQAFIPNGETCLDKVENLHLGFTAIDENVQVAVKWISITINLLKTKPYPIPLITINIKLVMQLKVVFLNILKYLIFAGGVIPILTECPPMMFG